MREERAPWLHYTDSRDAETEAETNNPCNPAIFLSQQVKKDDNFASLQHEDPHLKHC